MGVGPGRHVTYRSYENAPSGMFVTYQSDDAASFSIPLTEWSQIPEP